MTKNRIRYGLILVFSALLFLFYHNFFFFYLLAVVVLLPAISYFISRNVWNSLSVTPDIKLYSVGTDNRIPVEFTVSNSSMFPVQGVKAEFIVENRFYPNEEVQEITLPVRRNENVYGWNMESVYAGYVGLQGRKLTMQDYLGLFRFEKEWNAEAGVSVIPHTDEVVMRLLESAVTEGDESESDNGDAVEDVTQVKEFREYKPGDRIQRVNWKLSAKHDNLYVKEFEQEFSRTLTLLPELRRDTDKIGFLDEVITAFYSTAAQLIEMEIRFNVKWYDCEQGKFRTEPVEEPDGLLDVLQQIFMMKSYEDFEAYSHYIETKSGKNETAIYFTSPSFPGISESVKIGSYKERVVLICV